MSDNRTIGEDRGCVIRQIGHMIISPGRQYIFAHMPKTGGTSFAAALEERAHKDDILIGDTPKALRRKPRLAGLSSSGRLWKHSTLADIEGIVTQAQMNNWFVVTLVRNPWDRVVSYYHWLRDQRFDHPAVGLAQSAPFSEFVLNDGVRRALQANPVSHFTRDSLGHDQSNLVVRLERFTEDAVPFWDHLGFQLELPHLNRSQRTQSYTNYYTDDTRAAVAEACREDILKFDYRFGA